ncbi:MAG: SLATT domain-containing protein [Hyphomicrobiales bacterium]
MAKGKEASPEAERELFPSVEKELNAFLYALNFTKGSRFEAARRYKKRAHYTNLSIMVLSLYVMIFTLIPVFVPFKLDTGSSAFLFISTVTMSAAIIGFSLFESGKRHDLRAELLLKSARQISDLHWETRVYAAEGKISAEKVWEYIKNYSKILADFEDNHAHMDFTYFKTNIHKPKTFEKIELKYQKCNHKKLKLTPEELLETKVELKKLKKRDRANSRRKLRAKFQTFMHIHAVFLVSVASPAIVWVALKLIMRLFEIKIPPTALTG